MITRCWACHHPEHMHNTSGCHATDVTGPPSADGKRVGDGYVHIGRTSTACECDRFVARLTVVYP